MGSRSIGELLLRPTALTRMPLMQTSWRTSQRTLTNSASSHSAQPQPKPREEPAQDPQRQPPTTDTANPYVDMLSSSSAVRRPLRQSSSEQVSQGIDNLLASTNSPNFRRTAPSATRTPTSLLGPNAAQSQPQRIFGAEWSPTSGGMQRRKPLDLNEMAMPDDGLAGLFNEPAARVPEIPESEKNYPRLNPSYGRKVELDVARGRDMVAGIRMLGAMVTRNKVRADFMKQRYHERPGLKRKRLKSERWRARFKVGFSEVTARVTELTKKGW